jgi:hypothetical protein
MQLAKRWPISKSSHPGRPPLFTIRGAGEAACLDKALCEVWRSFFVQGAEIAIPPRLRIGGT